MASIDQIETIIVDIPTIRGHVLSMTTMQQQSIVLVRIRFADGSEGIGEGTTIGGMSYGPESPESIKLAIDSYLGPAILGQDGDRINQLIARMRSHMRGNHIALCAVETALWDGLARRQGVSVAQLLGGRCSRPCRSPGRWPAAIRTPTSPRRGTCWRRAATTSSS